MQNKKTYILNKTFSSMEKAWAFLVKKQSDKRVLDDEKAYLSSLSIYHQLQYLSTLSSAKKSGKRRTPPKIVTVSMTWSTVKNDDDIDD